MNLLALLFGIQERSYQPAGGKKIPSFDQFLDFYALGDGKSSFEEYLHLFQKTQKRALLDADSSALETKTGSFALRSAYRLLDGSDPSVAKAAANAWSKSYASMPPRPSGGEIRQRSSFSQPFRTPLVQKPVDEVPSVEAGREKKGRPHLQNSPEPSSREGPPFHNAAKIPGEALKKKPRNDFGVRGSRLQESGSREYVKRGDGAQKIAGRDQKAAHPKSFFPPKEEIGAKTVAAKSDAQRVRKEPPKEDPWPKRDIHPSKEPFFGKDPVAKKVEKREFGVEKRVDRKNSFSPHAYLHHPFSSFQETIRIPFERKSPVDRASGSSFATPFAARSSRGVGADADDVRKDRALVPPKPPLFELQDSSPRQKIDKPALPDRTEFVKEERLVKGDRNAHLKSERATFVKEEPPKEPLEILHGVMETPMERGWMEPKKASTKKRMEPEAVQRAVAKKDLSLEPRVEPENEEREPFVAPDPSVGSFEKRLSSHPKAASLKEPHPVELRKRETPPSAQEEEEESPKPFMKEHRPFSKEEPFRVASLGEAMAPGGEEDPDPLESQTEVERAEPLYDGGAEPLPQQTHSSFRRFFWLRFESAKVLVQMQRNAVSMQFLSHQQFQLQGAREHVESVMQEYGFERYQVQIRDREKELVVNSKRTGTRRIARSVIDVKA